MELFDVKPGLNPLSWEVLVGKKTKGLLDNMELVLGHGAPEAQCLDRNKTQESSPEWMIPNCLKCPVIGICMRPREQKNILKKAGYSIKNKSEYEIHTMLVNSLSDENRLSKRIHTFLSGKFKRELSQFLELDRSEFLNEWKTHFQKGEIAGLLWVSAVRSDLRDEDISGIFGDIHMAMHSNACENTKLRKALSQKQEDNLRLGQRVRELITITRALRKENTRLKQELEEMHKAYSYAERQKREIEGEASGRCNNTEKPALEAENRKLKEELNRISEQAADYEGRIKSLQNQMSRLVSKLDREREMNACLKEEMQRNMKEIQAVNRCDQTCPSFNLCRRRILIVGGIARMESLYKDLIEGNGGVFEYHDGCLKGGLKGLKNQVRRADMVICPVDINSHNACLAVKKWGKKYRTPVYMVSNSGLSAVSRVITEIAKQHRDN